MTTDLRILAIVIVAALGSPLGGYAAPEAWYIEMPETHASFLIEASAADDIDAYKKILGRIPELIRARTFVEIERFERDDANAGDTKIKGRVIPDRDEMFGGKRHQSSGSYGGREDMGEIRLYQPRTKVGLPEFQLYTHRKVGRQWMPTWTYAVEEGKVNVLLERDLQSDSEREVPQGKFELTATTPDNGTVRLTWLVPTVAMSKSLSFRDAEFAKIYGIENFRYYGFMFTLGQKAGQETGFRAKFVNQKKPGTDETFNVYGRDFDPASPFEAAFAKKKTTYSRDTGGASDEDEGQEGQLVIKFSEVAGS